MFRKLRGICFLLVLKGVIVQYIYIYVIVMWYSIAMSDKCSQSCLIRIR